jgi:uncharacterized membrane protein
MNYPVRCLAVIVLVAGLTVALVIRAEPSAASVAREAEATATRPPLPAMATSTAAPKATEAPKDEPPPTSPATAQSPDPTPTATPGAMLLPASGKGGARSGWGMGSIAVLVVLLLVWCGISWRRPVVCRVRRQNDPSER